MVGGVSRRAFLGVAGGAVLAGCLGRDGPGGGGLGDGVEEVSFEHDFEIAYVGADPPSGEPVDAPPFSDRVLPLPMPPSQLKGRIHSSGPGFRKDGIPSVDDPVFVNADAAGFLADESMVFGIASERETKAYPRRVLVLHEIVNDVLGGTPVSVTYCPLTGTALGFERGQTEFGVSGLLVNNNLVMYDRAACRLWPQILATSTPGPLFFANTPGGATLREVRVVRTTWGQWRRRYPDTSVMTEDTGFARNYAQDPYARSGYYDRDATLFPNLFTDDRHHAKTWVYGARTEEGAAAFLKETLVAAGVIHGRLGTTPHVAVYDPGLDTAHVYRNPDDRRFRLEDESDRVSADNGDSYPPAGLPLEAVGCFDAYWFAWIASYPHTVVYQ